MIWGFVGGKGIAEGICGGSCDEYDPPLKGWTICGSLLINEPQQILATVFQNSPLKLKF